MKLMVIGFPKSGTTSLTKALNASGMKAAHWQDDQGRFVGALIYRALLNGRDPFSDLSGYQAITQADVCLPGRGISFWPNLDFSVLRAIRRAYPHCLFLLNYRRPEAICDSIIAWKDLQARLTMASVPGLPRGFGRQREHLLAWIENHFDACHAYFANDERFLEIDIENPDVPGRLGAALGIELVGWGNHKPDPDRPTA